MIWIRIQLKRFWKWLAGLFVIGIALVVGITLTPPTYKEILGSTWEQRLLSKIEIFENAYYATHQDYWHGLTNKLDTIDKVNVVWPSTSKALGNYIQIDSYFSSCGKGYQVLFRGEQDELDYIHSFGYGCEAEERTYTWTEKKWDNSTTTPK